MTIREATTSDYQDMIALHSDTVQRVCASLYAADAVEEWSTRNTIEKFERFAPKTKMWVATEEDTLLGFAITPTANPKVWFCYVSADHQKKGVGSRLLKKVEDYWRERGAKTIVLDASLNAVTFYESHGYRQVKEDVFQMKQHVLPIVLMEKSL